MLRLSHVVFNAVQVLQFEMERLSLSKAAANDKAASSRLKGLDKQLLALKSEQKELTKQWQVGFLRKHHEHPSIDV